MAVLTYLYLASDCFTTFISCSRYDNIRFNKARPSRNKLCCCKTLSLISVTLPSMEFIVIVHPNQRRSARLKKQAHAHAARVTHARSRKRQAARHSDQEPDIKIDARGRSRNLRQPEEKGTSRPQQELVESQHLAEPSIPRTVSGAFEHEPLASFLKSSTAEEKMLFFYCTSQYTSFMPLLKAMRGHWHCKSAEF